MSDVAPANVHDSKLLMPVVNKVRKTKKLRIIAADAAFHVKKLSRDCKKRNFALIASPNPRRDKNIHKFNVPHRWVVEQTFGILSWNRGLKICWAKTLPAAKGFLQLACSLRVFKMAGIFG